MLPEPHYLHDSLERRLLLPSPLPGIYWTPSVAAKLQRTGRNHSAVMSIADFFIGPYDRLKHVRTLANKLTPGIWSGSEIHHIVEHHHLQFLGVRQPFSRQTYRHHEPCVVLSLRDHNLVMENLIGDAVRTVLGGDRGVDFLDEFNRANPGAATLSHTEQGKISAGWVLAQESTSTSRVNRRTIRDWLVEIYAFAYQQPEFAPLRSVALSVLKGVPL